MAEWILHPSVHFLNSLMTAWRMVNQTQISSGSSIQNFLSLSLHKFFPFLCDHIAFFHIERRKEIHVQVKSCHKYSVSWGFEVRDSLSRIFQILSRLSFFGSFTKNSNTTSQTTFLPPETIKARAWKQKKSVCHHQLVISVPLPNYQMIDLACVSFRVTSSFKKVKFLRDSILPIQKDTHHFGQLLSFLLKILSYRTN